MAVTAVSDRVADLGTHMVLSTRRRGMASSCHTPCVWCSAVHAEQPLLSAAPVPGASALGAWSLDIDDGTGVRVARSSFHGHLKFSWDLFRGFRSCRVLTYSIDLMTVRRLVAELGVDDLECVIGTVATINRVEKVLAVQQAAMQQAVVLVDELSKTECDVVEALSCGRLAFWVVRDQVSHSKLYLLEGGTNPARRIIMGSANFSEQAFRGWQHETLAMYDDDDCGVGLLQRPLSRGPRQSLPADRPSNLLLGRTQPVEVEESACDLSGDLASIVLVGDDASRRWKTRRTRSAASGQDDLRNQIGHASASGAPRRPDPEPGPQDPHPSRPAETSPETPPNRPLSRSQR